MVIYILILIQTFDLRFTFNLHFFVNCYEPQFNKIVLTDQQVQVNSESVI